MHVYLKNNRDLKKTLGFMQIAKDEIQNIFFQVPSTYCKLKVTYTHSHQNFVLRFMLYPN